MEKDRLLWIAGSTMKGEEQILLQTFQDMNRKNPFKLMIAPRHPERFDEVAELIRQNHLSMIRRSSNQSGDTQVFLLDSIGELAACYELADVVLIGGTLGTYGGHNPIEPAYFGKAIFAGPHYENFRTVFEDLRHQGAIIISTTIEADLGRLLRNADLREQMGISAQSLVHKNTGAIDIVLHKVRTSLHDNDLDTASKLPL
jgi:3-deoxy-D-manno-octulosonic-acid transferase